MRQPGNKAGADWVGDIHKYDRDRPRLPLKCSGLRGRFCEDHVGLQIDQLFGVHARPIDAATGPTNVRPHVAAVGPTQLSKPLHELGQVGFCVRIVFVERRQPPNPPRPAKLLCVRDKRCRDSRAAD